MCRSVEEDILDRVRACASTEAYQKALRKRSVWVEPLFAARNEVGDGGHVQQKPFPPLFLAAFGWCTRRFSEEWPFPSPMCSDSSMLIKECNFTLLMSLFRVFFNRL